MVAMAQVLDACGLHREQELATEDGRTVTCIGDMSVNDTLVVLGAGGALWRNQQPCAPHEFLPGYNFKVG